MADTRQVDAVTLEVLAGGEYTPKVSAAVFEVLAGGVYTPQADGMALEVLVDATAQQLSGAGSATVTFSASGTGQRTAVGAGAASLSFSASGTGSVATTTVRRVGDRRRKIRKA